jgi:hypothetical protein
MRKSNEMEDLKGKGKGKGQSNPITGLDRPISLQEPEAPRYQDNRHMIEGGKVVSPAYWLPLPPRNYSRYSFLLEAESTPGP